MLLHSVLDDLHAVFGALHSVSDHFISDSDAKEFIISRVHSRRVQYRQSSFSESSISQHDNHFEKVSSDNYYEKRYKIIGSVPNLLENEYGKTNGSM